MAAVETETSKDVTQTFFGASREILDAERNVPPEKLYHYTSSQGFLGIIEKGCLWFSDSAFMNDGSEIAYGIDMLRYVLRAYMHDKPEHEQKTAARVFDTIREQSFYHRTIIFCMSNEGNLLNQWRDYGKDVTAYSIELDTLALIEKDKYSFYPVLFPLIYDQEKQLKLTHSLIEEIYSRAMKLPSDLSDAQQDSLLMSAAAEMSFLIGQFKNPAFQAENEWRLAAFVGASSAALVPKFRPSSLGVVPYYTWSRKNDGKLPISKVIVGPTPYADASHIAARQFMDRNGYEGVEVAYSTIPIRRT